MTPTHWIHRPLAHCEEANVVFFRGLTPHALTQGLLDQRRMPLAHGKGTDWGVLVHYMHSWDTDEYDSADYGPLCAAGGELAVFVTEPCIAKAHGPWFSYYRDGRLICGFSFETPTLPVGDEPELLLPALEAAKLIGAQAQPDGDYREERIVETIAGFLGLPELEMP
ncbi:hypothetical protein ABT065_08895 [Streptomyces sp. NPDC002764]|uniref:hypothetical protein n=1 Tax=unclassified Streptomyces TaxID=2593676 RepID=UPI0033246E30